MRRQRMREIVDNSLLIEERSGLPNDLKISLVYAALFSSGTMSFVPSKQIPSCLLIDCGQVSAPQHIFVASCEL